MGLGHCELLAGALPVPFGLVRIDFAHPLQQFFGVRLLNFGAGRTVATTAGARSNWTRLLCLVRHMQKFLLIRLAQLAA